MPLINNIQLYNTINHPLILSDVIQLPIQSLREFSNLTVCDKLFKGNFTVKQDNDP